MRNRKGDRPRTGADRKNDYRTWALGLVSGLVLGGIGYLYNRSIEQSRIAEQVRNSQVAYERERRKEALAYYADLATTIEGTLVGWRSIAQRLENGMPVPELRKAYGTYAVDLSEWAKRWELSRVLICEHFGPRALDIYITEVIRPFRSLQDSLRLRLKTPSGEYRQKPSRARLAFRYDPVAAGFRKLGRSLQQSSRPDSISTCFEPAPVTVAIEPTRSQPPRGARSSQPKPAAQTPTAAEDTTSPPPSTDTSRSLPQAQAGETDPSTPPDTASEGRLTGQDSSPVSTQVLDTPNDYAPDTAAAPTGHDTLTTGDFPPDTAPPERVSD